MGIHLRRNTLGDLAGDLRTASVQSQRKLREVVKRNVREGREQARANARRSSGPHGKNYYKRITSEMTGLLSGEFGPHGIVENNAVGAGWRNAHNTDLARAADVIGIQLAGDVDDVLDELFWPGT
jgi:hypothetical protein